MIDSESTKELSESRAAEIRPINEEWEKFEIEEIKREEKFSAAKPENSKIRPEISIEERKLEESKNWEIKPGGISEMKEIDREIKREQSAEEIVFWTSGE